MKNTEELLQFMESINSQIEDLIARSNKREMFDEISALDDVTNKHLNSVRDITIKICNRMGMTEEEIRFYATCAFLHDIGKILVPPYILQKPTSLTPEEFEIMKNHTINGFEICRLNDVLRPYANAALYHHENEDGSGYPYGIRGSKIPMEARIIKVADIYDAICSRRQYKKEVRRIDALKIVYEEVNKGKVNRKIFDYLLDVIISELQEEEGDNTSEILELRAMKNRSSYIRIRDCLSKLIVRTPILGKRQDERLDERLDEKII